MIKLKDNPMKSSKEKWTYRQLFDFLEDTDKKNPMPWFYEDLNPRVLSDSEMASGMALHASQTLKFKDPVTGEVKEGTITWKDKNDFNKGVDINI